MTVDWDSLIGHLVHDVRALARKGMSSAQLLERALGPGIAPEAAMLLRSVIESQRDLNLLITRIGALAEAERPPTGNGPDDFLDLDYIVLAIKVQWKDALRDAAGELAISELPVCKVSARLQAVISELVSNSINYRHADRPLRIGIDGEAENAMLRISVTDNGPAWNPAYGDKLFQPLERLEVRKGGCGLGLAIARASAEAVGGRISGQPEASGARFDIEMPIVS